MLSMGCLGIVLEVSFRTVPNVIMKCHKLTVDQEWLIANHERLNQEHLFVKTWWFAWTGEAHVWLVDPASEFEARAYRAAGCLPLDLGSGGGPAALLDPTVEATMLKMGADTKNEALDGQHIETMRRFKKRQRFDRQCLPAVVQGDSRSPNQLRGVRSFRQIGRSLRHPQTMATGAS
jgi:hypothetical protein